MSSPLKKINMRFLSEIKVTAYNEARSKIHPNIRYQLHRKLTEELTSHIWSQVYDEILVPIHNQIADNRGIEI